MKYITYAHILNGEVYQVGDFGAVALWYSPGRDLGFLWWKLTFFSSSVGCHQVRIWMIFIPFSEVVCGDYITNSRMKAENDSSMSSSHCSIPQSTFNEARHLIIFRSAVLADREPQSWYLVYLGTRPDARGKGYARKLVEYITAQVLPFPKLYPIIRVET